MASSDNSQVWRRLLSADLLDVLVRVGLIAVMTIMCFRVFSPFLNLLLWALILAVALYPLHQRFAGYTGGRQGRAAVLLVVVALLLLGAPTVILGGLFADQIHSTYDAFAANEVQIEAPDSSVANWPLVGEKLYAAWNEAATDMPAFLDSLQPQLGELTAKALAAAKSTMGSVLLFVGSLIIAGIMMAYGQGGSSATRDIISRLTGVDQGPRLHSLVTATIRSVATGVIGVAFIQALLLGIGFVLAGIPAAGLLAIIVMLVGIIQLPAAIISLPAIGYLWWSGDASTTSNIVWSIYLVVAGMADNVLKPLLLGRGVEAPMPIILIGALGGMVSAGIVGLFLGSVLLAVGYRLFMDWVHQGAAPPLDEGIAEGAEQAAASPAG